MTPLADVSESPLTVPGALTIDTRASAFRHRNVDVSLEIKPTLIVCLKLQPKKGEILPLISL